MEPAGERGIGLDIAGGRTAAGGDHEGGLAAFEEGLDLDWDSCTLGVTVEPPPPECHHDVAAIGHPVSHRYEIADFGTLRILF